MTPFFIYFWNIEFCYFDSKTVLLKECRVDTMRFIQIVFVLYLERRVMIYVVENNKRLRIIFTESFYYGAGAITSYLGASWNYTDYMSTFCTQSVSTNQCWYVNEVG